MKTKSFILSQIIILAVVSSIAACGGKKKGGGAGAPPPPVPPTCTGNCNIPQDGILRYFSNLTITNKSTYKDMLEDLFFCTVPPWGLGYSDCGTWDEHAEIALEVQHSSTYPMNANVIINGYSIIWGIPQGGNSAIFTGQLYRINGDTGLEFQGLGPAGAFNKFLNVVATTGNITDTSLNVIIDYNGVQFGKATLRRY